MRCRMGIIGMGFALLIILTINASGKRAADETRTPAVQNAETPHLAVRGRQATTSLRPLPRPARATSGTRLHWYVVNGGGEIIIQSSAHASGLSVGQGVVGDADGPGTRARLGFWYCDCGQKGDLDCSGDTDPMDVVYLVNCVYRNRCALCDPPMCPFPTGDTDCDGNVTPIDVVILVNYVYRGYDAVRYGCSF